jgi:DNA repair exonuclease SbcCD ATPase subunit
MSDVYSLQDQIAKKKSEIDADQKAIEDLREQLRREGGDPGWLRNVPAGQPNEGPPEKPPGKPGTKEYWQARFKLVRARLADAEERQQLVEDELNLLQIQDVRALDPNLKAELDGKIKAKEDEVLQKQAATKQAQRDLENLQQEFQASGAPEEWGQSEVSSQ